MGKLAVCVLLLLWILHAIFLQEGRKSWENRGGAWEPLSRAEQWKVAWTAGPPELWETLRLVDSLSLWMSVLVVGGVLLLGMIRWGVVLRALQIRIPWGRNFEISLIAHFFNSFLLGTAGGDLMKAFYASREAEHRKTDAVVTVFVDRLIGFWSMLMFAGAMIAFHPQRVRQDLFTGAVSSLILVLLGLCTLFALLAFRGGISRRWPAARRLFQKLPRGEVLEECLDACRRFGRRKRSLAAALFISMLLNLLCVVQVHLLATGLGLPVSWPTLLVLVPMIITLSALPITPSGLGVRENLYVVLLTAAGAGISATSALALSLLAFTGSIGWSLAGGLVYLARRRRITPAPSPGIETAAG